MHSPSRLEAIFQTIWYWVKSFRLRPPARLESNEAHDRRWVLHRRTVTREQLKHEYGFDDDN